MKEGDVLSRRTKRWWKNFFGHLITLIGFVVYSYVVYYIGYGVGYIAYTRDKAKKFAESVKIEIKSDAEKVFLLKGSEIIMEDNFKLENVMWNHYPTETNARVGIDSMTIEGDDLLKQDATVMYQAKISRKFAEKAKSLAKSDTVAVYLHQ